MSRLNSLIDGVTQLTNIYIDVVDDEEDVNFANAIKEDCRIVKQEFKDNEKALSQADAEISNLRDLLDKEIDKNKELEERMLEAVLLVREVREEFRELKKDMANQAIL